MWRWKLLAYPMAFVFERGGRSIAGPAILHTSTNTPAIILALPEELMATGLVTHMGVILVSVYLVFLVSRRGHRASCRVGSSDPTDPEGSAHVRT